MKLTVFGATGRTGQQVVKAALAAGHLVTAFARTPSKLDFDDTNLEIVKGEITNSASVSNAIQGADAVISCLGPVPGGPQEIMAPAAREITAAMKAAGVKRLIWTTGAGVSAEGDQPTLMNKLITSMLKLMASKVLEDSLAGAEIITGSGLEWILARAPMLTDQPGSGSYRVGLVDRDLGRTLSRENYAAAMLELLESDRWLRGMPAISDR